LGQFVLFLFSAQYDNFIPPSPWQKMALPAPLSRVLFWEFIDNSNNPGCRDHEIFRT